jgi:suppressor for copper-sensitivity B
MPAPPRPAAPTRRSGLPGASGWALLAAVLASISAWAPAGAAHAAAGPWQENPQSKVRLITPYAVAPATGELRLGLHFTVAPGWHVYWKNSGDAGFPPAIDFAPTPAVRGAELLWPAPERFDLPGGLVAFGYEDEAVYPIRAQIAAAGERTLTLAADLDYLVCQVDCVPYRYRLSVEQPLAAGEGTGGGVRPDPATAPLLAAWWERLPVPAERAVGIDTRAALDLADPRHPALVVDVDGESARRARRPDLFLAVHDLFTAGAPQLARTAAGLRFRVPLEYRQVPKAPVATADFAWTVTGLDPAGGGPVAVETARTVTALTAAPPPDLLGRFGDPALIAVIALAATALALWGWGLLGGRRGGRVREALGFAALAAAVALLYLLSSRLSAEGLAFVELTLLAGALVAWLRRRAAGRPLRRATLTCALAALAALTVWLAARSRVAATSDSLHPPGAVAGVDSPPRP